MLFKSFIFTGSFLSFIINSLDAVNYVIFDPDNNIYVSEEATVHAVTAKLISLKEQKEITIKEKEGEEKVFKIKKIVSESFKYKTSGFRDENSVKERDLEKAIKYLNKKPKDDYVLSADFEDFKGKTKITLIRQRPEPKRSTSVVVYLEEAPSGVNKQALARARSFYNPLSSIVTRLSKERKTNSLSLYNIP